MSERHEKGCDLDQVRAAKSEALTAFGRLAKVAGIGITRTGKGYGLKVNLQTAPDISVVLPKEIRGVPIRIEVVGPIKKRPAVLGIRPRR
jgi:hypothetical protein